MILKAFREKSNHKYINKLLNARKVAVSSKKINSIGVILNLSEFSDFETFRVSLKALGIPPNKTKVIAFVEDEKGVNQLWDSYFNPKDFGWKGKILNTELETFINTEFDALISYYKKDVLQLNLMSAASNANFKIGLSNNDHRLYDLIIDVKPNKFSIFMNELKKYLTVLNKI
ncbi:hypothetical protein A9Q87_00755 [Flavobacteriales bacterium 34_180_T64]|nr:hypothetical protein A9Q87_00755 [Flavobacteriales bacterium 34_180_T64]